MTMDPSHTNPAEDSKATVFFDIDNTLYPASSKIADAMGERIHAYFTSLGLDDDEASTMHHKYIKTYGLALRGLVQHHAVDTLDFDRRCDQSLPLEEMIGPVPAVRKLLQDIDRTKVHVWALTNAYSMHARRVLRILELEDQFEGIIFCDYERKDFYCKPEPEYFNAALRKAGVTDPSKCFFVDDSLTNVVAAHRLGWGHCIHICETGVQTAEGGVKKTILSTTPNLSTSELGQPPQISTLEELRTVWPEIFKGSS